MTDLLYKSHLIKSTSLLSKEGPMFRSCHSHRRSRRQTHITSSHLNPSSTYNIITEGEDMQVKVLSKVVLELISLVACI